MRSRRGNILRLMAAAALIAILAACGNGGGPNVTGGGGGIVGTGKDVVAIGEVNGLGVVVVNGIEFVRSGDPSAPTAPILLAFDNVSTAREDALRTGMVVTVSGSYDSASGKGSYTRIVFSPELRGPLDSGSVNAAGGSFSVLGRTVRTGAATVFDGILDLSELAGRQDQGLELEVSGYLDAQGMIQASRVALKSTGFAGGTVQIKGSPAALDDGSFRIGGLVVTTDGADFVNMTAADLAVPGLVIEVRGTLAGGGVNNARIERRSSTAGAAAGGTIRLKGVAAGPVAGGSFIMAGPDGTLTVTIDGTSFQRGRNAADASIVVAGARLEVEGTVREDGSLAARKVAAETQRSVRLEGKLTAVDLPSGTLTLNGVTVKAGSATVFRDNRKAPPPAVDLTLAGLSPGEHLRVIGFPDADGQVLAGEVQRFDAGEVAILQGPVTSLDRDARHLVILGVPVIPDSGAELVRGVTSFGDFVSFAAQVAPGSTVIKARGIPTGSGFSAGSLEIEQ